MKFNIVVYTHRHGVDAWPIPKDDTEDEAIASLDDWEPEYDFLEVHGPFDTNDIGAK